MALQRAAHVDEPGLQEVSTDVAPLYGWRNSCDLCFSSKLRCSREKPTCARCRKQRVVCNYSPTKRPGRRRKVATSLDARHCPDPTKPPNIQSDLTGIKEPTDSDQASSTGSHEMIQPTSIYLDPQYFPTCMMDGDSEQFVDFMDCLGAPAMLDTEFSTGAPHSIGEEGLTVLESSGEEFDLLNNLGSTTSSPQTSDQFVLSPDSSWLPNSEQFSAECVSLERWTSSPPSSLQLPDVSRQDFTYKQWLCHTAMANLQFHRKSALKMRPAGALEVCLHLQRLLQRTRSIQKECHGCRDDDLVKLVVAGITSQVVEKYLTIIEDNAKGLRPMASSSRSNQFSGMRFQNQQPLFDLTSLRFGSKSIQGAAKAAFLRRLIGLKLR